MITEKQKIQNDPCYPGEPPPHPPRRHRQRWFSKQLLRWTTNGWFFNALKMSYFQTRHWRKWELWTAIMLLYAYKLSLSRSLLMKSKLTMTACRKNDGLHMRSERASQVLPSQYCHRRRSSLLFKHLLQSTLSHHFSHRSKTKQDKMSCAHHQMNVLGFIWWWSIKSWNVSAWIVDISQKNTARLGWVACFLIYSYSAFLAVLLFC